MHNHKQAAAIILSILLLTITHTVIAGQSTNEIPLQEGKNHIQLNLSIQASKLVALNPKIEHITYQDEFLNKSIGYVNVFGGLGKNFIMQPTQTYEISVQSNTTLQLPSKK